MAPYRFLLYMELLVAANLFKNPFWAAVLGGASGHILYKHLLGGDYTIHIPVCVLLFIVGDEDARLNRLLANSFVDNVVI